MVRWRRPKDPQTWVEWMWHDHLWLMRWARIRYEARVFWWWVIHPREMWVHRKERRLMMSDPKQDKKNVGLPKQPKQPRPPKEYRDEQ